MNGDVVVTGSLAFDHIMNLPDKFSDHILPEKVHILNVSFLVDDLRKQRGGTGGNIAYSLALLGIKVKLVATVGGDAGEYLERLKKVGVDIGGVKVFRGILTASGFVITDKDDNQIWSFYGGAMRKASQVPLQSFKQRPQMVVIAPNDPRAMVEYAKGCLHRGWEYMFDPAFYIPTLPKAQLKAAVAGAKIVIGNDYEMEMMKRRIGFSNKGVNDKQVLVVTLGDKGSVVRQGSNEWQIPAARVKKLVDPTGAGDAYRAGFVAGFIKGLPLGVCGRMGAVSASYSVEKYGTQTHDFSLREFKQRYRNNFGEELIW